ncbi:MAG: AAA family ATPase [Pseudomonadales bacterium]|nr:AAA family ATPase [Pseudomonadales bacterium]
MTRQKVPLQLTEQQLYNHCDPAQFEFTNTLDLTEPSAQIGQQRAIDAINFALDIKRDGYNLYVLGNPGSGRHETAMQVLQGQAAREETPHDWCYVHNFTQPNKPIALCLPNGSGKRFSDDMAQLLEDLHSSIRAAFESDEYQARRKIIEQGLIQRRDNAIAEHREQALANSVMLVPTPTGFSFAPLKGEEVIKPEEFRKLPEEKRTEFEEIVVDLQNKLQDTLEQFPIWEKEMRTQMKQLNNEITLAAVNLLINQLREPYQEQTAIQHYLDDFQKDVIENANEFLLSEEELSSNPFMAAPTFTRYTVNPLITHENGSGAPVIYIDHPTHSSLIGRIEYQSQYGALSTDISLIRPGALHEAHGGYLVVDADKLLTQPMAWDTLKRTLKSKMVRIEGLDQAYGFASTVTLEPQPIPVDLKVVIIGDRRLYYLLSEYDPEFRELFKVMADFEDEMDRSADTYQQFAQLIASLAHREELLPLQPAAVARVIEQSSRLIGDSKKVSISHDKIRDLLVEADFFAQRDQHNEIERADVHNAVRSKITRHDRIRERVQEQILRETVFIDCEGEHIGQINALAVLSLGDFSFGRPSRITARVRAGSAGVVDIERRVDLGGPSHSKGVLILSSYLGAHYCPDRPLTLSANLAFEQSYGGVDGDSASSTELYALISALAQLPIKQSLAVTGSVNQFGQVQPIGGVNEKIEGFFDICAARGLTGDQGVLIPASNVQHLMLRQDVIDACSKQQFHIYPIETIDQGLSILTGVNAGKRNKNGTFQKNSIHQLAEARLRQFTKHMKPGSAKEAGSNSSTSSSDTDE